MVPVAHAALVAYRLHGVNAAAAVGLCTTQDLVLRDEVCAAAVAVAAQVALAALVGMCSSVLLFSICICFCPTRCAGCAQARWSGLTLCWLRTGWVISGLSDAAIMSDRNDNVQLIVSPLSKSMSDHQPVSCGPHIISDQPVDPCCPRRDCLQFFGCVFVR